MTPSLSKIRGSARPFVAASAALLISLAASADAAPIITSVGGCVDGSGSTTGECPTAGNVPITIRGEAFGAAGAHAYVGGNDCPALGQTDQALVCALPPGSGANVDLVVTDSTGLASLPARLLSYSPPSITSVTGCTDTPDGSTSECARTGNVPLTIYGHDFGPAGSSKIVMFGGQICPTTDDDDDSIVCTLPPGSGTAKPALVLSSNQLSVGTLYQLSYAQCPPGTTLNVATGACSSCPAGQFSSSSDASSCSACPAGTVSDAGSSSCSGSSSLQCWAAKDVSSVKFTPVDDLSVSDEVASTGTVDVKKLAMYCTAADVSNSGVPTPDVHQCCYQVKGAKLDTAKQADTSDSIGGARKVSVSSPKMVCMSCTATFP